MENDLQLRGSYESSPPCTSIYIRVYFFYIHMYIYMPRTHTYICVYMFHELNDSIQALFEGLCAAGKAKQAHFEVMLRTSTSWEDRLSILKRYVYTHIVFMCYICVYVNIHACTCMHVFNFSLFLNWLLSANRVRGRSVCGFRKGVCINT